MAQDITTELANILNAKYGETVRQSIHDAIKKCYTDGVWDPTQTTGLVDVLAREAINRMNDRSTGNVTETVLYDSETNPNGELWRNGDQFTLDCDGAPENLFEFIIVYYKVVYTAQPELHIFKAADFVAGPVVIGGEFFEQTQTGTTITNVAKMRKLHIYPRGGSNVDFIINYASQWEADEQKQPTDGDVSTSITTIQASTDDAATRAGGCITKITGISYQSMESAFETYITQNSVATFENDTLVI